MRCVVPVLYRRLARTWQRNTPPRSEGFRLGVRRPVPALPGLIHLRWPSNHTLDF